jgi:hypothetical protein
MPGPKASCIPTKHPITNAQGGSSPNMKHSILPKKQYVPRRHDDDTVEGFFSVCKRSMTGVYQYCSEKYLERYLNEVDFLYSHRAILRVDDTERSTLAIKVATGKRLYYPQPHGRGAAYAAASEAARVAGEPTTGSLCSWNPSSAKSGS